jgi:uncharacterized repeat protein (TIGR01451 family)
VKRLGNSSKRLCAAGTLLSALAVGHQAQAQFPRVESFNSSTATGFRIGGSAELTGGKSDTNGSGYLRLTAAVNNQAGFAIDGTSFPTPSGFSISFEFFSYGTTNAGGIGADGFSVFLIDADEVSAASFTSGASGGSLGYAQKAIPNEPNNITNSKGVPFGYIGIGIDEYGNFSNVTEGRVGGRTTGPGITSDGRTPNSIAIRGAGNGNSNTDYPYLAGTGVLPFRLESATARAQNGSADYRRAFIDALPQPDQTYLITVRIQHGNQVYTAINNLRVPKAPNNLRIGFAGSTGGINNVHEIRSLAVVKGPFANDDVAGTRYDQDVTLNAISNDIFSGSQYQVGSLDLDVELPGVQNTITIANKGTFTADAQGQVTFKPLRSFAGVVSVPYTVRDILYTAANPSESSPATITIIVNGADLATSVSGPNSANPGSKITYTVNTSNLGTEAAASIIPTIQLPTGLSGVSVSSGAYDLGSGLVTFGEIASLAANDAPITNTVTFTVPASGPLTGTATFKSPPAIPDPVVANNVATITTAIIGLANIATTCATPGKDGPGTLNATTAPNTYYPGVSVAAVSGTSSVTIGQSRTGAGTNNVPVASGDLVLIMQMQGADITTSNTAAYGTVIDNTAYTAGKYEYAIVQSVTASTGGNQVLTLAKALTNSYSTAANTTNIGQRRFQVVRIPQYSSLTLSGTVSGAAWDGATGGILALDVAGRTTYATNASLSMSAKGFRGGGGSTSIVADASAYTSLSSAGNGSKGEGTAGTPIRIYNGASVVETGSGYPIGSHAAGAPGNAGGGATDFSILNNANSGGGGGTNGGTGGTGGYGYTSNSGGIRALGGRDISADATASRLFMGGGGGAGSATTGDNALNSSGGVGGGIIILRSAVISTASGATGSLLIQADGGDAPTAGIAPAQNANLQGAGGGGAGGTVIVMTTPPNGATPSLTNVTVNVAGGAGGNAGHFETGSGNTRRQNGYGPGGGGGGGKYYANGALNNTSTVVGGIGGTTRDGDGNNPAITLYGAAAGTGGVASITTPASATPTIAGAGSCLPVLTASLATSTPNVTRNSTGVNPATYTLTVSNTGGIATGVTIQTALATDIFRYDNTVTPTVAMKRADGSAASVDGYNLSANGTSTPAFSNFTIPAGGSLSITFQASIASTAVNNFAYQANATVSYTNPLRDATSTTATVSPGGNYAGGTTTTLGAASGASYTASASTAEDVTIIRPLPVELKEFKAAAVRQDARLTWSTASELNNDRFVIERSYDGLTFAPFTSIQGKGTTNKQSTYSYTDAGVGRQNGLVYYRLKQLDFDGTATFSPVRAVKFSALATTDISVYPNPTQGGATLDLTVLPAGDYQVQLLDLTGRTLQQFTLAGQREHALPVQALPHGSYIVRVRGAAVSVALPLLRN